MSATARVLASIALDKIRQEGTLRVRQGENLRRALTRAADAFEWESIPGTSADRVAIASKDVMELADVGAQLLDDDLADVVTYKKGEIVQIEKVSKAIRALASDARTIYPTQIEYSHTMRNALGGLVTKTVTLNLNDAAGALSAAAALEKRLEGLGRLRDQMLEDLKDKRMQIKTMRKGLPRFVEVSNGLLVEILAISS